MFFSVHADIWQVIRTKNVKVKKNTNEHIKMEYLS